MPIAPRRLRAASGSASRGDQLVPPRGTQPLEDRSASRQRTIAASGRRSGAASATSRNDGSERAERHQGVGRAAAPVTRGDETRRAKRRCSPPASRESWVEWPSRSKVRFADNSDAGEEACGLGRRGETTEPSAPDGSAQRCKREGGVDHALQVSPRARGIRGPCQRPIETVGGESDRADERIWPVCG